MTEKEFTAVVLAGGVGTKLTPLSTNYPKAMLPVANNPMISYALKWLVNGGFTKPLIVVTQTHSAQIEAWAAQACPEIGCTPSFQVIPDETMSAQALKAVASKIERNAFVVSCDTITDISISNVLSFHRSKQSTATVVVKHAKPLDQKSKERHLPEYMGLEDDNRLTFFASEAEFSNTTAPLPRGYLSRRPSVTLTRSLFDSHIYVLSKWALDLICSSKRILSLKHELLPLLAEEQFRRLKSDGTWGSLGVAPPAVAPLPQLDAPFPSLLCPEDLGCGRIVPQVYDPLRVYAYIADNDGKLAVDPTELKRLHMKGTVDEEYLTRVNYVRYVSNVKYFLDRDSDD